MRVDGAVQVHGLRAGKILLVGESMGLFAACEEGDCSQVRTFEASVAGAELNVAVGLRRLGQHPMYCTRLGDDTFAERIRGFMEQNGLDTSLVVTDAKRPTGFMMKTNAPGGDPRTYYFRKGSAASAISAEDMRNLDMNGMSLVHVTGILPPLSDSTMEATRALMECAKNAHLFISFDPNLRPALWDDESSMCSCLRELAARADLVLPGIGEGERLFGCSDPEDVGKAFIDNGAKLAVVKDGALGALATDGDRSVYVPGFVVDSVVDSVGAGDGFAAGVLSALLEGRSVVEALERGCAIGAMQTQSPSDNEGLPNKAELGLFMRAHRRAAVPSSCTMSVQSAD